MLDRVGSHVDVMRELELVIDLAPQHMHHVEIKPLQVEDQIVRNIFQTSTK
jgi:hypothetical protein